MVKVETEILEDRQARLIATVEQERVEQEMRAAARRIAKNVNIPGFRKGKAPYQIITQYYGEAAILEEALEELGQSVYRDALEQSGIEPYAPGSLDDFQQDPFTLTYTVPLIPEVELGDYRSIRIPHEAPEVTDEDVDRALQELQDEQASLEPAERAVDWGDVALLDILGTLVRGEEEEATEAEAAEEAAGDAAGDDGEEAEPRNDTWLNREDVRVRIAEEATYPVPGFPQQVVGMAAGDERTFDISFDEDEEVAQTLRGKTLHFEVKCKEVYEYNAPELNDEFAKDLGEFETLEELRADISQQIQQAMEREQRNEYVNQIFEELLEKELVKVTYPPVMLHEQIHRLMEDFDRQLRQQGLNLEEYKRLQKIDDDQLHEDLRPEAERQLKQALILGEIAEAEELGVSDADIEDEISTAILPYGAQAELARQLFSSAEMRGSIANRILAEKTIDRLIAIARGEDPPVGEPEREEPEPEAEAEAQPAAAVEEAAEGEAAVEPVEPVAEADVDTAPAVAAEEDDTEDITDVVVDTGEAEVTEQPGNAETEEPEE